MVLGLRIIIAAVFAIVLMYMFRPELHPGWGVVLAVFLMIIVYIREHFRKKRLTDDSDKTP